MSPRISIRLLAAQTDQRLLALARDGHERAFEALVHRYRRPLLRYARRIGLVEARAEEVVQQAFMKAWIALDRGEEVRDARGWLYRIVHNAALNAIRGPAEVHGELTEALEDRAALVGASNLERRIALREALSEVAALPRMQRQAIFLTAVDGQSHDEVAGRLGITPGAVRGLLHRARTTLRSAAAALIPQPLLELTARGSEAGVSATERALELTAGAGAAGATGLLLKAGVAVVTAGTLAAGASVIASHEHEHRGASHVRSQAAPALRASVQARSSSNPAATRLAELPRRGTGGKGSSGTGIDRRRQSKAPRVGGRGGGGDRRRGPQAVQRGGSQADLTTTVHDRRDQLDADSPSLPRSDRDRSHHRGSRGHFDPARPEASDADRGPLRDDRQDGRGGDSRHSGGGEPGETQSAVAERSDEAPALPVTTDGNNPSSGSGGSQSGSGSDSPSQTSGSAPAS